MPQSFAHKEEKRPNIQLLSAVPNLSGYNLAEDLVHLRAEGHIRQLDHSIIYIVDDQSWPLLAIGFAVNQSVAR